MVSPTLNEAIWRSSFFEAEVVIISFSAEGAILLYHLTKLGSTDAMLLKKSELESGPKRQATARMHATNVKTDG